MRERKLPVSLVALAAGVVSLVLLWFTFYHDSSATSIVEAEKSPISPPKSSKPCIEHWSFDVRRDSRNLGLMDEQCDIAFPKLYTELDRARDHIGKSSVNQEQVQIWRADEPFPHGQAHVLIHNGQMYIIDYKEGACERARAIAGLSNLYRAIIAHPDPTTIPDVEFIMDIEDTPTQGVPDDRIIWAWNRPINESNTWLMPDFDGWAFPEADLGSYVSFRQRLQFYEKPFDEKDARAVWRGAMNNPVREALMEASSDKEWADIQTMDRDTRMHMAEFCAYQFPVHTEGKTWSGRLRYLQNCHSVSIIHDLNYMAHYYSLLEPEGPDQNYIHVQADWSDLEEKMEWYRNNPLDAQRIANNSVNTFRDRYLTPAAEACYWRRMIRNWAEVQNFTPQAYEETSGENDFKKQRGIDWEVWVNPDPNFPF
ncbi:hypothetical protein FKW77_008238 [Venturia effusa]|uniref:Glycosyl transferase CAP10 domain-containing protein n=1 Tax=Venturia effusa TaxID=50376 RepID=A0A517LKU9_9PEZI|nr:hypothetical protein FKW77_008238 [Venturia effusa]